MKTAIFFVLAMLAVNSMADVEGIQAKIMEAAQSPKSARLMDWLYSFRDRKDRIVLPKDSKDLMACEACTEALNLLVGLYTSPLPPNFTLEEFNTAIKNVCIELNLLSEPACNGIIDNYAPILEEVYFTQEVPPGILCAILLGEGECVGVEGAQLDDWTVDIDPNVPAVEPKTVPDDPPSTQRVLHISDFHFDQTYTPGNKVECDDIFMCCTENAGPAGPGELAAGYWGDYQCDLPEWTLEAMLSIIRDTEDIDFILMTGDYPGHDMWFQSQDFNLETAATVVNMVKDIFPGVKVLPSLGNHEAYPGNIYSTSSAVPAEYEMSWLYNGLADLYTGWIPEEDLDDFRNGGYYSTSLGNGLKFIAVNSLFAYSMNFWLGLEYRDPMSQLQWLQDELLLAEAAGEKVWILSHMPPGNHDCLSTWGREYNKIIERYENIIMNQFYGHTHNDEFKVFYDTQAGTRPTSVGFVTPSATPYTNTNLAYRIYTVDGDYDESTRRVLDYDTYIGDLSRAPDGPTESLPFYKLYNAKDDLGLPDLLPASYDDLIVRLKDDDELWEDFITYYSSASPVAEEVASDEETRQDILCNTATTDRASDAKCIALYTEVDDPGSGSGKIVGNILVIAFAIMNLLWN